MTYVEDSEPPELSSYQSRRLRASFESERTSSREILRSAAIPLLIVVCIVLYMEPRRNGGFMLSTRSSCVEPDAIMKLKPSSTGEYV